MASFYSYQTRVSYSIIVRETRVFITKGQFCFFEFYNIFLIFMYQNSNGELEHKHNQELARSTFDQSSKLYSDNNDKPVMLYIIHHYITSRQVQEDIK